MNSSRGIGLRTQILLIVLGAAIVPMALVGLWLTRGVMRSGEDLLRSHLTQSADRFIAAAKSRWEYRQADVAFVAENDASLRAVTSPDLGDADRNYLDALAANIARTIPTVELRDLDDRIRWSSSPQSRAAQMPPRDQVLADQTLRAAGPTFRLETPVVDGSGRKVGTAATGIALSAVVPPDSARPLIPGAKLAARYSTTGAVLVALDSRQPFPNSDRLAVNNETWLAVHRSMTNPPIDFVIAAPVTSYIAPFKRAGTIGVTALLIVAALAVLSASGLALRATRPLEQLAIASDAVNNGNLEPRVAIAGPAEVRRVGSAFNLMTENLRSTLDALSRRSAMAAVGEFAASLSHDVRNALTSIRVDLDRLSMRELNDPVAATVVGRALNSVARLETAVSGALRVARRGQTPLKDVDLRTPIRAATEVVRGTMAALPAELTVVLPAAQLPVLGDAAALQQLFANLLFNAAQAMSAGGVARIIAAFEDNDVHVTVSDSGSGISAENLAKLETPFFSTKSDGTGLGLPIARQIVAAHGGSLTIESGEGSGTTVHIRLPLRTNHSHDVNTSRREPEAIRRVDTSATHVR